MKWAAGPLCRKCGKLLSPNNAGDTCYNCREHSHDFERGYTCCEYGQLARSIVFSLKYGNRPDIAKTIAEVMHDRLDSVRDLASYDVITAVPVHGDKLKTRGYNQAGIIAEYLARFEGKPYLDDILIRTSETAAMKGLTPEERRINIHGAFELNPESAGFDVITTGAKVLLVDDIYTTGATADEISRILKCGGASEVVLISFAAGADVIKSE